MKRTIINIAIASWFALSFTFAQASPPKGDGQTSTMKKKFNESDKNASDTSSSTETPGIGTGAPDIGTGTPGIGSGVPDIGIGTPGIDAGIPDIDTQTPGINTGIRGTSGGGSTSSSSGGASGSEH